MIPIPLCTLCFRYSTTLMLYVSISVPSRSSSSTHIRMPFPLKQGCVTEKTNRAPGFSSRVSERISGRDLRHVHQRHRTDCGVEPALAERQQLVFIRRVQRLILDVLYAGRLSVLARPRQEPLGEIERHHVYARPRHLARKLPVPAGDIQQRLAALEVEQSHLRRRD